jgi:hypothetical protein
MIINMYDPETLQKITKKHEQKKQEQQQKCHQERLAQLNAEYAVVREGGRTRVLHFDRHLMADASLVFSPLKISAISFSTS